MISNEAASLAKETALQIAARLADPKELSKLLEAAVANGRSPVGWRATGMSGSAVSVLALMSAAFQATEDPQFAEATLRYLKVVAAGTRSNPLTAPGLYSGSSGYNLVLDDICQWEPRIDELRKSIAESHRWQVEQLVRQPIPKEIGPWSYDLIDGPSGILLALLSSDREFGHGESRLQVALAEKLASLVMLEVDGLPRARVNPSCYLPMQDHLRSSFPNGYVDLGLAHGVPGILAALSAASQAGHTSKHVQSALRDGHDWLWSQAITDAHGDNWASGVDAIDPEKLQGPTRTAWCYGAPGVALALVRSAEALGDAESLARAHRAVSSSLLRAQDHSNESSSTLCHGDAGLVAVSISSGDANDKSILELISHFDSKNPFGYVDLNDQLEKIDDPGYLTGAAGVALTLLQASGYSSRVLSTATLLKPALLVNSIE